MIHPDCKKKVMELGKGQSTNRGFVDIFNAIANENEMKDIPSGTMVVPFYDAESCLKPGDWAAELHFVVRRVESVDETQNADSDSSSEADQEG